MKSSYKNLQVKFKSIFFGGKTISTTALIKHVPLKITKMDAIQQEEFYLRHTVMISDNLIIKLLATFFQMETILKYLEKINKKKLTSGTYYKMIGSQYDQYFG